MLIQNMTKLHEEILVAFYEPGPDGPPLFDDAEGLAVNLTDTVLESSIRLGWECFSWPIFKSAHITCPDNNNAQV
jgi:hypothetical protein